MCKLYLSFLHDKYIVMSSSSAVVENQENKLLWSWKQLRLLSVWQTILAVSAGVFVGVVVLWLVFPRALHTIGLGRALKGGMFPLGAGAVDGFHPLTTAVFGTV
jgi:hypothetical protein